MAPYREPPLEQIVCPRCKKQKLPPLDVATCDCGAWVTCFAASVVLTAADLHPNQATRWWRVREPCPLCREQMTLFGDQPGLLQGCPLHGYWIDADTIEHTGLARGVDHAAIDSKRSNSILMEAERESQLRERALIAERANEARIRAQAEQAALEAVREHVRQRAKLVAEGDLFDALDEPGRILLSRILSLEEANRGLEQRLAKLEQRFANG